jgi:hypothetical protein
LISSQKLNGDQKVIESAKNFILEGSSAVVMRRMP